MMQYIVEGKKVVASSIGTLKYSECMCSAESKKVMTIPWLQHIDEGKKVPTFETLVCLMLMCLWVFIWSTELLVASSWLLAHCFALLSTELSAASSWLLAHCLAHFKNQGNLTSFRKGFERIALRSTNKGNLVVQFVFLVIEQSICNLWSTGNNLVKNNDRYNRPVWQISNVCACVR